jgi:hypothetical protein
MAKFGGPQPGSGRPKGKRDTVDPHSKERPAETPLDYLLSVVRDVDADPRFRMEAAKAAAPYCHAKPVAKAAVDEAAQAIAAKKPDIWEGLLAQ